ncbi:hypothetical protein L2735_10490 [Shewanella olleyana]|uniref:hypothetical protein n=1 Tax=Shewanella olleyana TaxID=135626 RepID=UPI00200E77B2|nr:hypothetical protein [Shewanella olleyana]MCL1067235.1 hypothetical protein [Shewanella olleyana]
MPKGHHYGRSQVRPYTSEYPKIKAIIFKDMLTRPLGLFTLHSNQLSEEHSKFESKETKQGKRYLQFDINDTPHRILLELDNRSASNKLYITCPYCNKPRQHLYAIKYAYACRGCIGLHYACQSERPQERLMRRIRKLRKELWGYDWPDVNNMFEQVTYWPKPKWMRWKTFELKRNKITELERRYWGLAIPQLKTMFGAQFMENN